MAIIPLVNICGMNEEAGERVPKVNSQSVGNIKRTQDIPVCELAPLRMDESTRQGRGKALECA